MWVSRKKYNRLKAELERTIIECLSLEDEKQHIKNKLEAYQEAKNKGCKKGEYCQACVYGQKRSDYIRYDADNVYAINQKNYYVCEFDCCKNFVRKENVVL